MGFNTARLLRLGAKRRNVVAMAVMVFAVAGCTAFAVWATRSQRDWQFVQSVGGIAVGTPYRIDDGRVLLPIDFDVSGLRAITTQPTLMNSAMNCAAPLVDVRSQVIAITVRTELADKGGYGPGCPDADLGDLAAGRYAVVYGSPDGSEHPLGTIEVP